MNAPPDQQPNPFPTEILASMFAGPEPTEVIAEYVWGARPGHRDDLVRRDRYEDGKPVERLYCLMDYFNPVAVIDAAGEVQERYAWSAFGLRMVVDPAWEPREESAFAFEFGFHGQFLDAETGYYNYGFRYYSPEIGRWLNRDPIGEKGGGNLYGFVENDATNGLDRLGLIDWIVKGNFGNASPGAGFPVMERVIVSTDTGDDLLAYRPKKGIFGGRDPDLYWCHGYTFGGSGAVDGPFSITGVAVELVLIDDGWEHVLCADSSATIAVFYSGAGIEHSGIISSVNIGDNGIFDENGSELDSKWGNGPQNTSSFALNAAKYGRYKCFTQYLGSGECVEPGQSEIRPSR